MTKYLKASVVPLVFLLNSCAFATDAQDVLAAAFAERSKVRSVDCEYVLRNHWGQVSKNHVIAEYNKVFFSTKVISEGVLPEGMTNGPNAEVFDGSTVASYYETGGQIRSFDTTASRKIDTPFRLAFQWVGDIARIREDERLSEWETWSLVSGKVVELSKIGSNLVVLKVTGIGDKGGDDYMLVTFDSNFGYFPVEERFFRNKQCVVETKCEVAWIVDGTGKKVVFPLRAEYRAGEKSYNTWRSHEVVRSTLRINHVIDPVQFTAAALPKGKAVDVDKLNSEIKAKLSTANAPNTTGNSRIIIGGILFASAFAIVSLLMRRKARSA